jgi:hypothetical protein
LHEGIDRSGFALGLHFPILIGQSIVFFMICESYRTVIVPAVVTACTSSVTHCIGGNVQLVNSFAWLVIFSLSYNIVWLLVLARPMGRMLFPETYWLSNNLITVGLLMLATFFVRYCGLDLIDGVFVYAVLLALNTITDFLLTGRVYLQEG